MKHFQTYQVFSNMPESLKFLETLSRNMWWCWHIDAIELFRRISPSRWGESVHNPIIFLNGIGREKFEELSENDGFLTHMHRVQNLFNKQVINGYEGGNKGKIAYFSMEFGIHESLPLFAGGLGILAGDHLKAAADIGLPLVGVGLFYKNGYFHQYLNHEGWQQEKFLETNIYNIPLSRAKSACGKELIVSVAGPHGNIHAMVWKIMVGQVPLFLMDTNIDDNPREIRDITSRLYPANAEMRLAQEVLLGIGGMQALKTMGISPDVCHMNEGHCAFYGIERLAQMMSDYNIDLEKARQILPRATVFTTHTPVAAGHDEFPPDMVRSYLAPFEERLGVSVDEIISWGQHKDSPADTSISMFVLALQMAEHCNGVSRLHGKVARKMWKYVWPKIPETEIPISHITNGIHIPSWISIDNAILLERYIGPEWYVKPLDRREGERINEIYDEELWRAHEMAKTRLMRVSRQCMARQHKERNAAKSLVQEAESVLDQDALTIAFARRFATYKRGTLLFSDPERFKSILTSKKYPVQFVFAGKAHPRDDAGKELIKSVVQFADTPELRHKIIFLEDYNIDMGRYLTQGADVWLNTPRRPFEACGTSGMKAAINGVLNLSILDGWWCEGYSKKTGWKIGDGEEFEDSEYQDHIESQALYNLLENEVIPRFYDRKEGNMPVRWLKMMKASMEMAIVNFSARRMVNKYNDQFYDISAKKYKKLLLNGGEGAKELALLQSRLENKWEEIWLESPVRNAAGPSRVGDTFDVTALVHLGEIKPDEINVELFFGKLKSWELISGKKVTPMTVKEDYKDGKYLYTCTLDCTAPGRYGFTARVIPSGDTLTRFTPGLIAWA
ncbi:MAG TPA: DUF3417 domain-containing protein [Desulfobacteraceae bacterium]|nr:DUF3417 domain-containing protein [Desulfobacteraceae bacterium]